MNGNELVESVSEYSNALKALADPKRLRVFWLLAHIDQRISVGEAMAVLGIAQYNASRHLTMLKDAKLVRAQREGKHVFYTLNQDGGRFIDTLLSAVRAIPESHFKTDIQTCRHLLTMREGRWP